MEDDIISLWQKREIQQMAIDYWNQVHIQASIAIMQGMMSDVDAIKTIFDYGKEEPITNRQEAFELAAKYAVNAADALIAELQKKGGNNA